MLCTAVAAVSCFGVFAAEQKISIKELDSFQLTLPEGMSAVTRSSAPDDRYFSLHGLDYNTTMASFEQADIYMQATDDMETVIVTLSVSDSDQSKSIGNFNQMDNNGLAEIAQNFQSYSDSSARYTECTPDEAGDDSMWLNFALYSTDASTGQSYRQYQSVTVYNGKFYSLTMQRNGKNVQSEDYGTLMSIVKSVRFKLDFFSSLFSSENTVLFIIIGAGALLLIVILIIIIVSVKRAKSRKKIEKNDKILEELAGKYSGFKPAGGASDAEQPVENDYPGDGYDDGYGYGEDDSFGGYEPEPQRYEPPKPEPRRYEPPKPEPRPEYGLVDFDLDDYDDGTPRKYSDEDIDRLLGDLEDDENFIEALPEMTADPEEPEGADSVTDTAAGNSGYSEYFEDEPEPEPEPEPEVEYVYLKEPPVKEAPAQPAPEEDEPTDEEDPGEAEPDGDPSPEDEEDEEFEEYASDEVLVRQEAKHNKFRDSEDFFDEAPNRRIYGVISSREIEEAEDYDVIGEVEQKAEKLEKEPQKKAPDVAGVMKKIGGGLKYFGVHCGYFAKNVTRSIKRRHAAKKRRQAEEERRRRARERTMAQRDRQPVRTSGGLVQVHKRTDRRPPQKRR